MAQGSCGELETLMSLSYDLGMLDRSTFEKLYPMQEEISKLLRGLISSLGRPKKWNKLNYTQHPTPYLPIRSLGF
jgi:hypothetical protein